MELLKQWSQFQHRPRGPVGHQGRRLISLPIDLPALNGRARRTGRAALTARPLLTPFSRHRHRLPTLARAFAGVIAAGDERPAVERDDIERRIILVSAIGAAHPHRAAIGAVTAIAPACARQIQSSERGSRPVSLTAWNVAPSNTTTCPRNARTSGRHGPSARQLPSLPRSPCSPRGPSTGSANLREALLNHFFHRAAELGGICPQLGNSRDILRLHRPQLLLQVVVTTGKYLR